MDNVQAWLADAPAQVVETTEHLLAQVQEMRGSETIYPAQDHILNALACTAPTEVRVVILGQDPYHEPGQAMGLSFSVPEGQKLPPSLRNIYKELSADLGIDMPSSGDLTSWTTQGVLLLNTTLTVRHGAANSHAKLGWRVLTGYVVRRCMELPQPVVFMGWGKPACKLIDDARAAVTCDTSNKFCLASTHPSPLSANRAAGDMPAFMGSRPFSRTNALLEQNGAVGIQWASVADSAQPSLF